MKNEKPIAIIGAGIAGLTAADFLRQKNIPFILYEGSKKIAGLATSFKDEEGFSYDFGAHFITNRLAEAIGIGAECRIVKHYGESISLDNKVYSYPFGLAQIPRLGISWCMEKLKSLTKRQKPKTATDWFFHHYGPILSNEIALPLLNSWSGYDGNKLSPAVGDGLFGGGGIAKTLYLKAAALITGRAVACGYNHEKPETPKVWHVYPENGIATVSEKLAESVQDSIKLEAPVNEIVVENEKVVAIRVKGELVEVAGVISTAPVNVLPKILKGTNSLHYLLNFRYRPMVFVNIRFKGRNLLPDTVLWLPEKKFPFFRLTEATISMPWLAPEGKTIITADIGCVVGDETWTMGEAQLAELCLKNLTPIIPDVRERFLSANVLKTPVAYPVFLNEYEEERQAFGKSTGIENLLSVGRNGEFSHMFMEDVYWRTRKKVGELIEKIKN